MNRFLVTFVGLFFSFLAMNQDVNPNYDKALAAEVGADDYGMKTYVFVLLRTGDNASSESEARSAAFSGHMKNINDLVEKGKLVVAGPMLENQKDYRGILILNVNNLKEAEELLSTDPAISENYLFPDMTLWYGSAALSKYLEASDKVRKINP